MICVAKELNQHQSATPIRRRLEGFACSRNASPIFLLVLCKRVLPYIDIVLLFWQKELKKNIFRLPESMGTGFLHFPISKALNDLVYLQTVWFLKNSICHSMFANGRQNWLRCSSDLQRISCGIVSFSGPWSVEQFSYWTK